MAFTTLALLGLAASILMLILKLAATYLIDSKELRRFPSPGLAAVTDLWALWYHWNNNRYEAVHAAHDRLGSIVRIQPLHLSFVEPQALKDIYGHGSRIMKSSYYDNVAADYHDIANATDRADHSRKRRFMSHIFSHKQVVTMEQVIDTNLSLLLKAFEQREGTNIDVRYWFNLFTFDAISSLIFSQPFGFLETGTDVTVAEKEDGTTYNVNLTKAFHDTTTYNAFMGHAQPDLASLIQRVFNLARSRYIRACEDFGAVCLYRVNQRIKNPPGSKNPDFFSKLEQPPKAQLAPMPFREQLAEAGIMLNAGNDTTASSLTNTIWLLAKHPPAFQRLRREIDALNLTSEEPPSFDTLMGLSYLRCCIDESLRLRPPVAIGLPRVTPPEGSTICGEFIKGGVTVSAPILELNRSASLFPSPSSFDPDRWCDSEQLPNLREYVQPFSIGGRSCIGRNLAMIELTKVIAAVVVRFDIQLVEKTVELPFVERFNMNPGDCWVRLTRRSPV